MDLIIFTFLWCCHTDTPGILSLGLSNFSLNHVPWILSSRHSLHLVSLTLPWSCHSLSLSLDLVTLTWILSLWHSLDLVTLKKPTSCHSSRSCSVDLFCHSCSLDLVTLTHSGSCPSHSLDLVTHAPWIMSLHISMILSETFPGPYRDSPWVLSLLSLLTINLASCNLEPLHIWPGDAFFSDMQVSHMTIMKNHIVLHSCSSCTCCRSRVCSKSRLCTCSPTKNTSLSTSG